MEIYTNGKLNIKTKMFYNSSIYENDSIQDIL